MRKNEWVVKRIFISSLTSLQISSLLKIEMEAIEHIWHPYIGVRFLSSVVFIDNPYAPAFLCWLQKGILFIQWFHWNWSCSILVFPLTGLEFSLQIPCFPVVLLWYWTGGMTLLVALWMIHHCFWPCVLIYFNGNSLEVCFFFFQRCCFDQ